MEINLEEESRNKLRLQRNTDYLYDHVDIDTVLPRLFQEGVISIDDKERIEWERTRKDKISTLLSICSDVPQFYHVFLESVDTFIKTKLEGTEILEEDLKIELQKCDDFVQEKVLALFNESEDESLYVSTLEDEIRQEFRNVGKRYAVHQEHLETIVITCFQNVRVKKNKRKRRFQNLARKKRDSENDSDSDHDNGNSKNDSPNQMDKVGPSLVRKRITEMSEDELCKALEEKMNVFKIDVEILSVIKEKEIKGSLFVEMNHEDTEYLFPSISAGSRIMLLKIRDKLVVEESGVKSEVQSALTERCQKENSQTERRFKETLRKFGTPTHLLDTYKQYALLHSSISRPHNLITPIHLFLAQKMNKKIADVHEWIANECVIFAAACLNTRTNGTVHFGVQKKDNTGNTEGEVIGIEVNKSKCKEALQREVQKRFYKDQQEIIWRCIGPMEFIYVATSNAKPNTLLVVEVDIVPHSVVLKDDAVFIKKGEFDRNAPNAILYSFRDDIPYPAPLDFDETLDYMKNKSKLSNYRRRQEKMQIDTQIDENLRQKFLNLFSGGEETLMSEVYPILFLSPFSGKMDEHFEKSNFHFIKYIDSCAVFDFGCDSNGNCMCHFIEIEQNQVVKRLTTDNFDKTNESNKEHPERFHNLVADLNESSLKPWIFCNGYEVMDIPQMSTFDWKQNRSVGFKEALRFYKDKIPEGRAMVMFLLFSKNYDVMLEAAEEVVTTFRDQWMLLAESEEIANHWMCELQRRNTVDKKMNKERCVIGIPWHHVNHMIQQITKAVNLPSCELPTSTGTFCVMTIKDKNKLCDLDILSRNECDNTEIAQDSETLKTCRVEVQEHFYHGGRVSWWNFWFGDDVLQRAKHDELLSLVKKYLEGQNEEEDNRVTIVNLIHQPGAGGTTSASHVLWELKSKHRCCIVKTITDDTCDQIVKFRNHDDPRRPQPPLVLIDNFDDESVHSLYSNLEFRAKQAAQRSEIPIKTFCVLLLCTRRTKMPTQVKANSVHLIHALDKRELEWFRNKYHTLEKRYEETGCRNPKLLISFNILKENFNQEYIKNAAKEFVDEIEVDKEKTLLTYLALINTYDIEFQSVPISAFDALMTHLPKTKEGSYTIRFGIYNPLRRFPRSWEKHMSNELQILLNILPSAGLGNNALKSLSIINALFAKEILEYLLSGTHLSKGDVMLEFLDSSIFKSQNRSVDQILKVVKDIMKKRVELENGKKEKFSPLVSTIIEEEDADKAAVVMDKVFHMTEDPMIAQQIARLYIHSSNWKKATTYAKMATDMKPQNSYLWDTYGQIFKNQLFEKFGKCVTTGENVTNEELTGLVSIAMEGLEKFHREQKESEKESRSTNNLGYVSEVKILILMLDLIGFSEINKSNLHKFLVNKDFNPHCFATLPPEMKEHLKKFQGYAETAMRKIEEKSSQLKDTFPNTNFRGISGSVHAHVLSSLRENVDHYFGEDSDSVPKGLNPSESVDFVRRRILRIGGRTLSNVLSLRREANGKEKLEKMYRHLNANMSSPHCNEFDIKTAISVIIAMQIDGCRNNVTQQEILDLSQKLYDMEDDPVKSVHPYLETYLFLVMLHWPTENKRNLKTCSLGKLQSAMKKLKVAFNKNHPRQLDYDNPFRKRETTYFFLGKETTCYEIVYYEELHDRHGGIYFKGDTVWQQPEVIERLKRLEGVLVNDGAEVTVEVETPDGNRMCLVVPTSITIGQRFLWQRKVYLYLGFSWSGPKAFDVSEESYESLDQMPSRSPRNVDSKQHLSKSKHPSISDVNDQQKIRKIHERLKKIEKLKKRRDRNDGEEEELRQEAQLRKQLHKIVEIRQQFLGN